MVTPAGCLYVNSSGIPERTQLRYEKENPVLKPVVVARLERFNRILKQTVDLY